MLIEKTAAVEENFRRRCFSFSSARAAFKAFLGAIGPWEEGSVLLPSYIGWSAREGSGVFDPVEELGLRAEFYRVDERLRIDLESLRDSFRARPVKLLVLIHYFGYVDPGCAEAARIAREHGALVLEDEAHALFSDLVGGISGRMGDACLFSLHKMLPVKTGGLLLLNPWASFLEEPGEPSSGPFPWHYDLCGISERRRENARLLSGLLARLADEVVPLWPALPPGVIPQTYPVLIRRASRDRLYEMMNGRGFGVVSLYHTLIRQLSEAEFPEAHRLSRHILNLPVHQDADAGSLESMVAGLEECLKTSPSAAR